MLQRNTKSSIAIVVGLGRSGISAAKLLNYLGQNVVVIEKSSDEKFKRISEELKSLGISVELGMPLKMSSFQPWIKELSLVVISPSIPWDCPTLNQLRNLGIKVQGEISLAWEKLKHIPWIGITGTNGKTTVTEMLYHILKKNEINAPIGGNIGIPATEIALQIAKDKDTLPSWLIIELSSFQIEAAPEISPKIGIWTTFTPDHLDRHNTLEKYFEIKKGVLDNSQTRIYNSDDESLNNNRNKLKDGIWTTTSDQKNSENQSKYWINEEGMICEGQETLFNSSSLKIPGNHNLQNLLLVTSAARKIGLSPKAIEEAINDFKGVNHRLEFLGQMNGINIYNDSKATNYDSAEVALQAVSSSSILIAGGKAKEGDASRWIMEINKNCSGVILFGKSAKILNNKIQSSGFKNEILLCKDLKQAVPLAISKGLELDVCNILLSPACSSFDQYKDFEERGNHFKELVIPFLDLYKNMLSK